MVPSPISKTAVFILMQAAFSDTPPLVQSLGGPAILVAIPALPPALPLAAAPDEPAAAKPGPAAAKPQTAPTDLVPPAEPPAQVREPSIRYVFGHTFDRQLAVRLPHMPARTFPCRSAANYA